MFTGQVKLSAEKVPAQAKVKAGNVVDTSFSELFLKENKSADTADTGQNLKAKGFIKRTDAIPDNSSRNNQLKFDKADDKMNFVSVNPKDGSVGDSCCYDNGILMKERPGDEDLEAAEVLAALINGLIMKISENTGISEDEIKNFVADSNFVFEDLPDMDTWKGLVVEAHGLNDASEILTADEAFKDLNAIAEILKDFNESVEMRQMTAGMTEGVTDTKDTFKEALEILFSSVKDENVITADIKKAGDTENGAFAITQDEEAPLEPVIAEDKEDASKPGGNGVFKRNTSVSVHTESGINTGNRIFENIIASVEGLEGSDSLAEGVTVKEILDQVTSQIKNLRAPDHTSLEMMLQPAALGKVAINVSSKNGVMQAQFRVESPEAKAALESQIADLKLNFENQGLKVEHIEIMLSEAGIGGRDSGKETEGQPEKGKNRSLRKIDLEDDIEAEEVSKEEAVRAYTGGAAGSNVDFTA